MSENFMLTLKSMFRPWTFPIVVSAVIWLVSLASVRASEEASRCHVFIDDENIWTLEMVQDRDHRRVPIMNIITLTRGKWEFRPPQVRVFNAKGKEARVKKFSLDTGVPEEPYRTEFMAVQGNAFIGLDLVGDFEDFGEPSQVTIDLGKNRFTLQPLDCLKYEALTEKINNINIDSPNIREDFEVLKISAEGTKRARPLQP